MFQFICEHGHWTILKDGQFFGTADTRYEAEVMIQEEI